MEKPIYFAAIEGGGTSFLVAIGELLIHESNDETFENKSKNSINLATDKEIEILNQIRISSEDPMETMQKCCEFLKENRPISSNKRKSFDAVGIACFGPLGVCLDDKMYGCVLPSTPKKSWRGVDIVTPLLESCKGDDIEPPPPHLLDTDVNAPALAEFRYGNNNDSSLAYVTVGTGVGVGLIVNSKPVHGRMHPEGGHICVSALPNDKFTGYSWGKTHSPYAGRHTVEGIASSVALLERLKLDSNVSSQFDSDDREVLAELEDTHEIWDHAANALANLCVSLVLLLSVHSIVLGGGLMKRKILYDKIRLRFKDIINGYLDLPNDLETFIRPPTWENTGLVGAFILAETAYSEHYPTKEKRFQKPNKETYWSGFWLGVTVSTFAVVSFSKIWNRKF